MEEGFVPDSDEGEYECSVEDASVLLQSVAYAHLLNHVTGKPVGFQLSLFSHWHWHHDLGGLYLLQT